MRKHTQVYIKRRIFRELATMGISCFTFWSRRDCANSFFTYYNKLYSQTKPISWQPLPKYILARRRISPNQSERLVYPESVRNININLDSIPSVSTARYASFSFCFSILFEIFFVRSKVSGPIVPRWAQIVIGTILTLFLMGAIAAGVYFSLQG